MNTSTPDILVVGGAGYIGSHVVKALRDAGRQPVVFDNLSTGLRENLFPDIPFIHGDLLIPEQVRDAIRGIRSVIHLAALKAAGDSMLEPERYALHNLNGTVNLLHAAGTAESAILFFPPVLQSMENRSTCLWTKTTQLNLPIFTDRRSCKSRCFCPGSAD